MQGVCRSSGPVPYRLLTVRVKRCPDDPQSFRYYVLEKDGQMAGGSIQSYASEAEAFRAGNAAARAIRRASPKAQQSCLLSSG